LNFESEPYPIEIISENEEEKYGSFNELDRLSGQDLADRHHLIWRPSHLRGTPGNVSQVSSQNSNGNGADLSFIAPSYSQSNYTPQYPNFNIASPAPRQQRVVTTHNSDAAAMSHYHGVRFHGIRNQALTSLRQHGPGNGYSLFGNDSRLSENSRASGSSSRNSSNRSNGMQEGFGPVQIPQGNTMRVEGNDTEENPEEPSVEIKQTIRTEYKIRKDGIVYVGAINETNIWGSHQHPECN
jgi:hypothetical protein